MDGQKRPYSTDVAKIVKKTTDNFLWEVEQIPGLVAGEDVTHTLRYGYWPSFNVPAIEEIYDKSGYPQVVDHFGEPPPLSLLLPPYPAYPTNLHNRQQFLLRYGS